MAAGGVVEFILHARDEASGVLSKVGTEVAGLKGGFEGLVTSAGGLGIAAAAFGGIAAAATMASISFQEQTETLERLSKRTGVTIEQMQVLRRVVEDEGGQADVLTMALQKLNRNIEDGNPLVKQLGLNTSNTFTAFMSLMSVLDQSTDSFKKTSIAMDLTGRGGGDLIAMAHALVTEYGAMDSQMRTTNELIGNDAPKVVDKLDKSVERLGSEWKGFTHTLGQVFVPVATLVVGSLNAIFATLRTIGAAFYDSLIAPMRELAKAREDLDRSNGAGSGRMADPATDGMRSHNGRLIDGQFFAGPMFEADVVATKKPLKQPTGKAKAKSFDERIADLLGADTYETLTKNGGVFDSPGKSKQGPLADVGKTMKDNEEFARKLDRTLQKAGESTRMLDGALAGMEQSVAGNIQQSIAVFVTGSENVGQAFSNMMNGIVQSMEEAAIRATAAFGLSALGGAIGGPVGAFIGNVAGNLSGSGSTGGSVTYNISTLDSKSFQQQLTSPSGSMRAANRRINDVARARA
jgi:hypothetical protein